MSRRGRKGFSPQFERDYNFYFNHKDTFTFAGTDVKRDYNIQFPGEPEPMEVDDDGVLKPLPFTVPYSPTGKSAKVCFYQLDSEGKCKPCSEPELLVQILRCKASVNLNIKIWAQSRAEYTLPLIELQEYLDFYQAPDWVLTAIENQKAKILKEWGKEGKYSSDYYRRIADNHINETLLSEFSPDEKGIEFVRQLQAKQEAARKDLLGSGDILDPNNSTNLSQDKP